MIGAITRSGLRVDLVNPVKDTITAKDIAEHLSKQVLHRGAPWCFYSLAQHNVLVNNEVVRSEGGLAGLYALLYRADEAFCELPSSKLQRVIHEAFNLDYPVPKGLREGIAHARRCVTLTEYKQLIEGCEPEIAELEAQGAKPIRGMIKPLNWDKALDDFVCALRANAVAEHLPKLPVWGDIL